MRRTRESLASLGLPADDPTPPPDSAKRFEDGAQYRIEIPSTEGPAALAAVISEADARGVPLHRVSQGSGIMLLTDDEIRAMVSMGDSGFPARAGMDPSLPPARCPTRDPPTARGRPRAGNSHRGRPPSRRGPTAHRPSAPAP